MRKTRTTSFKSKFKNTQATILNPDEDDDDFITPPRDMIHRSSSSEQFSYSDLSLVENKDNTDNNKDFSDKNDQNVNQCQVHQENEFEFNDNEVDYTLDDDNIDFQKEESHVTHDYVSPGGSSYWIPVVSDNIKPKINSIFDSYTSALSMYYNYASLAGFDVRLGLFRTTESDITTQRHLLCNWEGKPTTAMDPQHNKIQRRKDTFRCECKEKIVFTLVHGTNKYNVVEFVEQHNHKLFGKDNMFLSRTKRKLDYTQEIFIYNLPKQNIGASRAHRLYSGLQGGSDIRGGFVSDFKNSTRNLNSYIGVRDAKFLVVKMLERKKNIPSFSFDFKVVEKKLNSISWADETAKYNYNAFGDVVSLDATFSMNKYDMVFVPFTGIDNHKKCVTFRVGLLSREDASSYSWLLRAFLKAFKKQPTLVLTDQDPALNKAVNEITSQLATTSAFRKRFHSIIWNSKLEPHDFEKEWKSCLNEFNISNNKWLQEMYGLRRRWVPAFFKDIPMSGLMRTTSLSEGQNWLFQNNTLTGFYLLMFMMTFEGVMERQRRNEVVNDFNIATTLPRFITYSPIEPHASKVYTRKNFYQVQKEISDFDNTCFQMSVTFNNGVDTIIVLEKQKNITTRQPSSPIVDDKLEEYHYDRLTKDTQYIIHYYFNTA
ncbi:protein FAR1-RELATED SEQUENCE 5-like [Lactuca sativa]|uniref:protein FAR1-RELATED SEQUENCE 5-like n=1 Tax=Lactuca sativa TaxID=4236 RepID=UPI0022B03FA8|nr:protein FAR1-RELATED SEQUENCE 5-like [Lactuca sativa]